MPGKLCVFCTHLKFEYREGDDNPTCGYPDKSTIGCDKGHLDECQRDTFTEEHFRTMIQKAAQCDDYDQVKS